VIGPARFPDGLERRAAAEIRAAAGRRLEGYVATYGSEARIGRFIETVAPGAFTGTLAAGKDIVALVDHDAGRLLARTSSGTLKLSEDSRGLAFDLDVPDTQLGRDILALAERRDLGGMSFGFKVKAESWPARDRRNLLHVDLIEISIVQAFPAYGQTAIAARMAPDAMTALRLRRLVLIAEAGA
jgi:HK97 family phage prohead protease